MTNSQIFKAAHKLAKTFKGNYQACFSLALKQIKAGIFETKSYLGKKVTFICEIGCRYITTWGQALSTNIHVVYEGKKYRAEAYFKHFAIKKDGNNVCIMPLGSARSFESKFEEKMDINQGLFGSHIK